MFSYFLLTAVLLALANCGAIDNIRQQFASVRVDRARLAIANQALRRVKAHDFKYWLAIDELKGVKRENIAALADIVCSKLGFRHDHCDSVRSTFEALSFAEKSHAKLEELSLSSDGFESIYGLVLGAENSQGDVDIDYAIYQQVFSVSSPSGFTVEEMEAIKNHYSKYEALLALKQENFIASISYV